MRELKIKLLPHQSKFIDSTARYILNSGGVGSGKTWSICLKSIILAQKYPGIFILLGAQTYPLLRDTTLREFLNIIPDEMVLQYNKTEQHFKLHNGSEVIFRAFDDANKLKSLNLGACGIEEMTDVSEEIFKMLRTRLRQEGMPCQLYGATNPGVFENWVYKYFIENPIPDSEAIYSISADNEYLPESYLSDLENMRKSNPEYYARMVQGQWGALEGVIYNLPNKQRLPIQTEKKFYFKMERVFAGLDFGFQNPSALTVIGQRDGSFYIFDEVYRHKQSSTDIIEFVKEKMLEHRIEIIYCDSSRPEIIEELRRNGIPAVPSIKDVFDGIMFVKGLIGSGRIFTTANCSYTLREFDSYIWDAKNPLKEVPLKVNDHLMDAIRYALFTDNAGKIDWEDDSIVFGDDMITSKMDW